MIRLAPTARQSSTLCRANSRALLHRHDVRVEGRGHVHLVAGHLHHGTDLAAELVARAVAVVGGVAPLLDERGSSVFVSGPACGTIRRTVSAFGRRRRRPPWSRNRGVASEQALGLQLHRRPCLLRDPGLVLGGWRVRGGPGQRGRREIDNRCRRRGRADGRPPRIAAGPEHDQGDRGRYHGYGHQHPG